MIHILNSGSSYYDKTAFLAAFHKRIYGFTVISLDVMSLTVHIIKTLNWTGVAGHEDCCNWTVSLGPYGMQCNPNRVPIVTWK